MRKNDLVIYTKHSPHIKNLELGKIYTLESSNLVKLNEAHDNSVVESSNIVFLPKITFKILLKNYNQNYLEKIFKDISIFNENYVQNYLKTYSLGLIEHMDKINEQLIPYLIDQKRLYRNDLFAIVNIFQPIEIEDFDKIYNNHLNFNKLIKLEQENILYIKTFLNNYSENQLNKDTYKIFKNFISENIDNKEQQNNYRWKFERVAGNTSGYIYDKKRDQSILVKSCVDLINETKNINIDPKYFDYIDIKHLRVKDLNYFNDIDNNEKDLNFNNL